MTLQLEQDATNPTHYLVWDEGHDLVGTIDCTGPDEWRNSPITDGPHLPSRPVSIGPHLTKEAAFEEYQKRLNPDA